MPNLSFPWTEIVFDEKTKLKKKVSSFRGQDPVSEIAARGQVKKVPQAVAT